MSPYPKGVTLASIHPVSRTTAFHPIHGILSAYPLAFFSGALLTDIIYANSTQMQWANFSVWQITFGLIMGVAAAVVGIIDALAHRDRPRSRPWPHTIVTLLMMAFALLNAFIHSRDAYTSVVPTGLILSAITTLLALIAAWLGYSLEARQEAN
jgi:uncharacterized membrane protein